MYYPNRAVGRYFALSLTLFAPVVMQAGAISINSTCYVGNCAAVDSLSNGESTAGSFDVNYTFNDGDAYDVYGTYSASYSSIGGSTIDIDPVVSYLGTTPTIGTDTLDLMFLQNYFDPSCCTWAGTYTESVPLFATGSFGAGSQMSGELFYDNVGVGLVGPFTPPGSYFVTQSNNLDFGANDTIATLSADYQFDFTFGAGTLPGSGESAVTPEPVPFILCGLGLLMFVIGARRWDRSHLSKQ